ncbi:MULTISPECIES: hypothetical protein [Microbispora]|uniref:hypothetical protein n=1 Tax=Microbispora TaxID=2005 RepID=UPI001404FC3A|nr:MULTISPECIES: hypothetical protein [Microbispora]GLW23954.1 hypothetical protein Mame01_39970 [Microbispora amethystogenes]
MFHTIQSLGDRLLARLVPRVEASATVPCWCMQQRWCCYGGNYGYYCGEVGTC